MTTTPEQPETRQPATEQSDNMPYMRKIRSFVLREGRLTKGQQNALDNHWPAFGLDYQSEPLNLTEVFGRTAPVVLEIGFGMGKSLVEMAQNSPDKNFIGIEVHKPGVGACLGDAAAVGLSNLRLFEHDAVEVLNDTIADASLSTVQLFFPDPWHKKRHHKRRIVQGEFVTARNCRLVGCSIWLLTGRTTLSICLKSCRQPMALPTYLQPAIM